MAFFFQSIGTPAAVNTALNSMTASDTTNTAEVAMVTRVKAFVTAEINAMATISPQVQVLVDGNHSKKTAQLNMIIDLAAPSGGQQLTHIGVSNPQSPN